jgi:competence protein ComEC
MANGMISFLVALVIWAIIKQWNQSPFLLKFSFLKSRKRMFFVICILGIIIRIGFVYSINPIQKVSLHQLSVGQGDSLLYQQQTLQGQITGMVDVGSFYRFKVKDWLEVLNRYQVQQMDWLILTHLDEDHAGNLLKLLSLIPVKCVVIQEDFFKTEQWSHLNQTIREWGLNIRWAHQASDCELPSNISVMDLSLPVIKVLHKKTKRTQRGNQTMLGVQIQLTPDLSYYNFGDASKEQEMIFVTLNQRQHQMGNQYQRALSAALRGTRQNPVVKMPQTILKLSHHGSKYSTAEELLALFQETSKVTAWVSVGHNTYGHPHPRVLQTLNQRQIPLKRTDLMGDLSVECVQIDLFQWYHCGEKYINDR